MRRPLVAVGETFPRARAAVFLVPALLAGCPQDGGRRGPVATAPDPRPTVAASARAATPAASAAASPQPPLDLPAPRVKGRPPRTGAAGSTRGTIACGSTRCKAPGERCTWDLAKETWVCAPGAAADSAEVGFVCDDGTDCPQGETCCRRFDRAGQAHGACVARPEVDRRCSEELCMRGGANCPAGSTCSARSENDEGICERLTGPATCTGKKRCPVDRPICILLDAGSECVAHGSPSFHAVAPERRWQCTLADDCRPGDVCAFTFGESATDLGTSCAKYSPEHRGARICEPSGPSVAGHACRPLHGAPAWMGILDRNP